MQRSLLLVYYLKKRTSLGLSILSESNTYILLLHDVNMKLLISIFILLSCLCATTVIGANNETDRQALLEFKKRITDDPLGMMSSWNDSVHFCQWQGVRCGRRHRRVFVLDLHSLQLSGTLAPQIGNLSFLKAVDLGENSFSNEIPPEISRLKRLQILYIYNNSFSGRIPTNISRCTNLQYLSLARNQLIGKIPSDFGSLPKLEFISLGGNRLTGSIPATLGNLTSLKFLVLTYNYLEHSIPDTLGQIRNLQEIELDENRLSGSLPPSIFNLSFLTILAASGNQIGGILPLEMFIDLPSLQVLSIGSSGLYKGSIPVSVSNASELLVFDIGGNQFTGTVPSLQKLHKLRRFSIGLNKLGTGGQRDDDLSFLCSLVNATSLSYLAVNGNEFGGFIPKCIGNLSSVLTTLYLDFNALVGGVPTEIGHLKSLQELQMLHNNLTGPIPSDIGRLQRLVVLDMSTNKLSGEVPSSLGNLTSLIQLFLDENILHGCIPSSLAKCHELIELTLNDNSLSGSIPPQLLSISSLSVRLNLSTNYLSGSLPNEVGNLKNIGELDVSDNMLSGEIPSSLGSCTNLEVLDLSGNLFRGVFPSSFASLRGIEILDLSSNNLSGEIPEFLDHLHLLYLLNLSYNDFEGKLPTKGVFRNRSAIFIQGNNRVCGGIPELKLPRCELKPSIKKGVQVKLIVIIVASVISTLSLIFLFLFYLLRKRRNQPVVSSSENTILSVSYQSILKATNDFSKSNLIGTGSFGSVYRGTLDHDEATVVAIKVLNPLYRGALKSFVAECEALKNIRHRNLVKILTACSGIDYQGNDFKALIYEFMANGSLDEWLHPTLPLKIENDATDMAPSHSLGFLERLNILIDVASAMEYLHRYCEPPIAHCDLKPSNVLLDEEMTAHVGDFGLAKVLQEASSADASGNATNSSSIGLRGTIGYAPPEYGFGSEVSVQGDVYSFGILLLELFTGKRPTAEIFNEGLNLRAFVSDALPDTVRAITDPTMFNDQEETINSMCTGNAADVEVCLNSIFQIGIACSAESPRERSDMTAVAAELTRVRNKFVKGRSSAL